MSEGPLLFSNITLYLSVIEKKTYMYKWPVEQKNGPQAAKCKTVERGAFCSPCKDALE